MTAYDALVVGAGPNGLVAANVLADAGWSVLVVEAQPEPGGAVHSAGDVHPGFVHDTFSAFYPLAAASPAIRGLRLEEHGLAWSHAPAVLGHPLPDGRWALMHRDRHVTAALLDEDHPGDGDAWLALCADWDRVGAQVLEGLLSPFPPVRAALGALRRLPTAGGPAFLATLLSPAARQGAHRFGGDLARQLLAGNAGHADIPFDEVGSGLMGLVLAMTGQTVGFPVPVGGASGLTAALVARLRSRGGEVRCDAEVVGVDVDRGVATGVRLAGGERLRAGRAVVADVVAPHLYGGLVAADDLPRRVAWGMRRFRLDPSTVKVDWALDGPVPWASPPAHAPGTVHVADSLAQMTRTLHEVASGVVPTEPFLLVGQMTTSDPTRSPAGTESCWAYTHVPQGGSWGSDDLERFADRVQGRLERLAPGLGSRVLARRVLGPRELEARDANLVGGAINGGTARLRQELVLRPVPGGGGPGTGIGRLFLGSSSAHPGGGVHGAPGRNAALAALAAAGVSPRERRRAAPTGEGLG
ncbi:MAG: phytoene desaturase family protein [Nocardioides sp.]